MIVYLDGVKPARQPVFILSAAPASTARNQEVPEHWLEPDGKPRQFTIEFNFGKAEVEDDMGRYLLEQGVVRRTRLILPRELPPEDDPALVLG